MSNNDFIIENLVNDKGSLGTAQAVGAKQPKITATGILKGDGSGNVSAAVAGTDYSDIMPGDLYLGVDLTEKFAAEIANYPNAQAWIKAREQAGNYAGIHVGDWLPLRANNVDFCAQIMGIDTYTGYGDTEIGHHIDWKLLELWPTLKPINPANYNNGLIPVENVTSDGTSVEYTLTKEMNEVASIKMNDVALTGWSYAPETYKIKFEEAPAAGTMVVTGTGTEYPWLACDAYHFANSLAGQVPNGTGLNPAVKHVDYTTDGIYYYLPQEWKDIIIQKRMFLPKRYSATGVLSNANAGGWANIGYIWFPTECEVCGQGVFANTAYDMAGSALQYPLFAGNMNRAKRRSGSRSMWWLSSASSGGASIWCILSSNGNISNSGPATNGVALPVCFRT